MSRRITGTLVAVALATGLLALPAAPASAAPPACGAPAPPTDPPATTPTATDGGFTPLAPRRLLDTRAFDGAEPVPADCVVAVDLGTDTAGVPAGATAVALTVTSVGAARRGFVTAYPCASPLPLASNLNPRVSDPTSNLAIVPLDATRHVCLYSSVATHLVVDLTGYVSAAGDPFHPAASRLADTRLADPGPPATAARPIPAGGALVLGIGGTAVPADATGVIVNVTVTETIGAGYAVAYPCGTLPPTSTVNYLAGESRANEAYVGLDVTGRLCIVTSQTAHLVVDLVGWFGPGTADARGVRLAPRTPQRVLDTRTAGRTIATGTAPIENEVRIDLTGAGLPADTVAVVLDVVATNAKAAGYTVVHPCGAPLPDTSALNQVVGNEATNVVTVELGNDRSVCARTNTVADLVVDVLATFGAGGPLQDLAVGATDQVDTPVLAPAFDPRGLDYTVRCPVSGPLDLPLQVRTVPGLTATIVNPAGLTIGVPGTSTEGHAAPVADDAVAVRVTDVAGATVATYSIRCLPNDFPTLHTTLRTDPTPGWFVTGTAAGSGATGHFVMVLDDRGVPVWYRRTTTPVMDVRRTAEGNLAWSPLLAANLGFGLDPSTTYVEEALDGTQVRSYSTVGSPTDHHDMVQLPNGHTLLLTYELEQHVLLPGPPACANGTDDVWWSTIQEIDADGLVVWTWRSRDHLLATASTYLPAGAIPGCDLQHADSLDVAANGDVIVALAHLDTVLRIRRNPGGLDDGDVVWRLGGPDSTFTFLDDPLAGPARPHDARLSADGTLLTLVDNRTAKAGQRARVAAYRLDTLNGTARLEVAHDYTAPLTGEPWSAGMGSARLQPDGHLVVGWGDQTAPQLTEFDEHGTPVLTVDMVDAWAYRVVKVPAGAFDRDVLRATAGPV